MPMVARLIAGCDAARLLEPADQALDAVALSIGGAIKAGLWRLTASPPCTRSSPRSRRSPPTASHAPLPGPVPSGPLARAPQAHDEPMIFAPPGAPQAYPLKP